MSAPRRRAIAHALFATTIVFAALLTAPLTATAAPDVKAATASPAAASLTVAQMTQYVWAAQNQVRYDAGLATGYARDTRLDKVAMDWAYQQWKNGKMSHNPSYSTQIPAGWQRAGENVASGYTYDKVVAAWKASPSHYANMVHDYTSVGIGFYEADGKRYWSVVFAKYPGTAVPARPAPTPTPTPTPPDTAPTHADADSDARARPELPRRARAARRNPSSPWARRPSRPAPRAGRRAAPSSRVRSRRHAAASTTSPETARAWSARPSRPLPPSARPTPRRSG